MHTFISVQTEGGRHGHRFFFSFHRLLAIDEQGNYTLYAQNTLGTLCSLSTFGLIFHLFIFLFYEVMIHLNSNFSHVIIFIKLQFWLLRPIHFIRKKYILVLDSHRILRGLF